MTIDNGFQVALCAGGGGNIRHHNAIATEPGFRVQILIVKCQNWFYNYIHENDRKFIFQLGARDYNFLDIKIS